jgi:hypothetical protein
VGPAKEKLLRDILDLDEAEAARARIVVVGDPDETSGCHEEDVESEMAEFRRRLPSGAPAPNWVAAVDEARRDR